MTKSPINRASALIAAALLVFGIAQSHGQGTMTITFDNPPQPPNTSLTMNQYFESGVRFWWPDGSHGGLALVGAGNAGGSPDNGTTHLETYAGTYVTFSLSPVGVFNLVSFDATESYSTSPGPETLHVVGYNAYQPTTVAVDLTTDGTRHFQTFNLGPSFTNLGAVSITPSSWTGFALDNLVISGVPEPSTGGLLLLAAACAFGRSWVKRGRP
jgi:hypothetical protein